MLPILFLDEWTSLLLCFKLHESRTAVMSSAAAATLYQSFMFVTDKTIEGEIAGSCYPGEQHAAVVANELELTTLPVGTTQALGPTALLSSRTFVNRGPAQSFQL